MTSSRPACVLVWCRRNAALTRPRVLSAASLSAASDRELFPEDLLRMHSRTTYHELGKTLAR